MVEPPPKEHNEGTKLRRWKVFTIPGKSTRVLLSIRMRLALLVAPRVSSAHFRTVWNGWCTDARFRTMKGCTKVGPCRFGCSATAEDRIEHYAFCPQVCMFAERFLHIPRNSCNLTSLLLCQTGWSDNRLIRHAVLTYSVFRCVHALRFRPDRPNIYDMLEQFAKIAVQGHARSTSALAWDARHD